MLVQFVMLVFAFLSMLTLVADVGVASYTRVRAQYAAEAAAIEGLRLRAADASLRGVTNDGFVSDCIRRAGARNMARAPFENDPQAPDLQFNQTDNERYGDLVSGTFTFTPGPALDEDAAYERYDANGVADFVPSADPPESPAGTGLDGCPADSAFTQFPDFTSIPRSLEDPIRDNAMLARVRRTTSPRAARNNPLDDESSVSSSGPTVPFVFGQGSPLQGADGGDSTYSPKLDGLAVRGTAIATVAPARRVGRRDPMLPDVGALRIVFEAACWNLDAWGTRTNPDDPDEIWVSVTVSPSAGGDNWMLHTSSCADAGHVVRSRGWSVGDRPLAAELGAGAVLSLDESGFLPLFSPIENSLGAPVDRVVAFGRAQVCVAPAEGSACDEAATLPGGVLRLRRRGGPRSNLPFLPPQNASSFLPFGFSEPLTAREVQDILRFTNLADPQVRTMVQAPVLAR